jgi:hypothetical protein
MTNEMTIGRIILRQLGGRFIAMTGAKDLIDLGNGIQMTLPATMTKNRGSKLRITLNGDDLYDIEFGKIVRLEYRVLERLESVFVGDMHRLIEDMTGLATRL